MLALTPEQTEALASRAVMRRFFVWVQPRDRLTGAVEGFGFWDGAKSVSLDDGRVFHGDGRLVEVASLPATSHLSIPAATVTLSGTDAAVNETVRGYDAAQAPIEITLGIFHVETRALIGQPVRWFRGFVDEVDIKTPAGGGSSFIVLTCESMSRQMTIRRFGTRSPATLQERSPTDLFYDYTAAQREQPLYFGMKGPRG